MHHLADQDACIRRNLAPKLLFLWQACMILLLPGSPGPSVCLPISSLETSDRILTRTFDIRQSGSPSSPPLPSVSLTCIVNLRIEESICEYAHGKIKTCIYVSEACVYVCSHLYIHNKNAHAHVHIYINNSFTPSAVSMYCHVCIPTLPRPYLSTCARARLHVMHLYMHMISHVCDNNPHT
jgi:hypothetical protein